MNTITPVSINSKMVLPKQQHSAFAVNSTEQQDRFTPSFKSYAKTLKQTKNPLIWLTPLPLARLCSSLNLSPKEKCIRNILVKFPNGIENARPQEIFEEIGINCEEDKDGKLIISHYKSVIYDRYYKNKYVGKITFADLGIDENKLLENVKVIKSSADFRFSNATRVDNLEEVGGDLTLSKSWETDDDDDDYSGLYMQQFGSGSALPAGGSSCTIWELSKIESLKNLKRIGGCLSCNNNKDVDMSSLESVGKNLYISSINNSHLNNLKSVGGSLDMSYCNNLDLSKLENIGCYLMCKKCDNLNLSNLKDIGYFAKIDKCNNLDLSNLEHIGRDFELNGENVQAQRLKTVGGNLNLCGAKNVDLSSLDSIGKDTGIRKPIYFSRSTQDIKLKDYLKEQICIFRF